MDDFGERRHSKLKTEQQILPLKIEEIVNAGSKFPHIKLSCYGSLIYLDRLHLHHHVEVEVESIGTMVEHCKAFHFKIKQTFRTAHAGQQRFLKSVESK